MTDNKPDNQKRNELTWVDRPDKEGNWWRCRVGETKSFLVYVSKAENADGFYWEVWEEDCLYTLEQYLKLNPYYKYLYQPEPTPPLTV